MAANATIQRLSIELIKQAQEVLRQPKKRKQYNAVITLLEQGANPHMPDATKALLSKDETVYGAAVTYKFPDHILQMMRKTLRDPVPLIAPFNQKTYLRKDALLMLSAASLGQIGLLQTLIKHGADVYGRDSLGKTLLHSAAGHEGGQLDTLEMLLDDYFNDYEFNTEYDDVFGQTPLHEASTFGHVDIVHFLVRRGANVNFKDKFGQTPLHIAADNIQTECIRALIELGANVNAKDDFGRTPFCVALDPSHPWGSSSSSAADNARHVLLELGATIDKEDTVLFIRAITTGNSEIVRSMLDLGVDPNKTYNVPGYTHPHTPLVFAIQANRREIVELLISRGADPNKTDATGMKPLLYTLFDAKISLEYKLKFHILNNNNYNDGYNGIFALYEGEEYGRILPTIEDFSINKDMINLLLAHGANPYLTNQQGETAVAFAVKLGLPDDVIALLDTANQAHLNAYKAINPAAYERNAAHGRAVTKPSNVKNIYGRSANNYKKLVPPNSTRGGRRSRARRTRRNRRV